LALPSAPDEACLIPCNGGGRNPSNDGMAIGVRQQRAVVVAATVGGQ